MRLAKLTPWIASLWLLAGLALQFSQGERTWKRDERRAQERFDANDYAGAADLYADPLRRGVALFRVKVAEAGADVCIADINLASAEAVAADAQKHGVNAYAMQADCGDVSEIDAMIDGAVANMGRMDVIVNNAGVTRNAYIMDIDEGDWDRMHRVNSKGVFFAMQSACWNPNAAVYVYRV